MVAGQSPQCPGLNNNQQIILGQIQNSFQKDLLTDLCNSGFAFHQYQQPTRSFFTLDLLGDVNGNEPVFTNLIRTYYTIKIDSQQLINNFQASPSIERIETEFDRLASDLRVYPSCNSVAKTLFSSVYIKADEGEISAADRQMIELNIRIGLTQINVIVPTIKNEVSVVYSERYQGQTRGYNVLRVYYAVSNKLNH